MPQCVHRYCGRDLPPAVAFPPKAHVACAHVNAKNEPCEFSPSADVYDHEVLTLIVTENVLWDLGPDQAEVSSGEFAVVGKAGPDSPVAAEADLQPPAGSSPALPQPITVTAAGALAAELPQPPSVPTPRRKRVKKTVPDIRGEDDVDRWSP